MTVPQRVVHDRRRRVFEVLVEGDQVAGYAEYVPGEGTIAITHVVVEPEFAGQGYGSILAEAPLGEAWDHGLSVLPLCAFVREHVRRNPEHLPLVPPDQRSLIGDQGERPMIVCGSVGDSP